MYGRNFLNRSDRFLARAPTWTATHTELSLAQLGLSRYLRNLLLVDRLSATAEYVASGAPGAAY